MFKVLSGNGAAKEMGFNETISLWTGEKLICQEKMKNDNSPISDQCARTPRYFVKREGFKLLTL